MTDKEAEKLEKLIRNDPTHYIVQKFTALSVMDNHIVDLRLISDISDSKPIVAPIPWGRATPIEGSGKVNISSNGKETVVFVIDPKKYCKKILSKKINPKN